MIGIGGGGAGGGEPPDDWHAGLLRRQALRRIRMHVRKIMRRIRRLLQRAAHMSSQEFWNNIAYMGSFSYGD